MVTKQYLKTLIASNKIDQAIKKLLDFEGVDEEVRNDIIFQASRYNEYKEELLNATATNANLEIKINKIRLSLLEIINNLSDEGIKSVQAEKAPLGTNRKSLSRFIMIAVFAMLLLLIGVIIFIPCPSPSQYIFIRVMVALLLSTSGGLVSLLEIKYRGMSTLIFSSLIFFVIYFFDPAKQVIFNNCDNDPFEYTVHLNAAMSSSTYPKLKDASLKLRLENKFETSKVDENDDADFKSIPYKFKNNKVAVKLEAAYWKLETDSIHLIDKSSDINIIPDNSLAEIHGRVMEMEDGSIIPGVTIESQGIVAKSDSNGLFTINVPLQKQRVEYNINASKQGYGNFSGTATPATNEPLQILLSRKRK